MRIGLLWYDDTECSLAQKVALAAARYRKKFGAAPNICYVHPSMMLDAMDVQVGMVRVVASPTALRHHFWIGQATNAA